MNCIVGFTCGTFDLLHAGHILMLEECSYECNYLIIGLQTDPSIDRPEKNSPIQSVEERTIQLNAVKWVDEIVVYETEADLKKLLLKRRPNVRIIGMDWKGKSFTGHDIEDIEIYYNRRDHEYSSTELIKRIKNVRINKTL